MCTYSKHYPPYVAEHNIKCHKYLYKKDGIYLTPYTHMEVKEGEMYEISEEAKKKRQICVLEDYKEPYLITDENTPRISKFHDSFFEIAGGAFHSYIDFNAAKMFFTKHYLDACKVECGFKAAIAICIIPTGSEYFVGWNNITSSSSLISINGDWVQHTPTRTYSIQGSENCYASDKLYYHKIYDNLSDVDMFLI